MKHILEYEDHEIADLLGDLEGVGHAEKSKASIWFEYVTVDSAGKRNYFGDCYKILTTDPFFATGNLKSGSGKILKMISEGKFEYNTNGLYPNSRPSKNKIQQMAGEFLRRGEKLEGFCKTLGQQCLDLAREEYHRMQSDEVDFKVFVGPPEDSNHQSGQFFAIPDPVNVVEYSN